MKFRLGFVSNSSSSSFTCSFCDHEVSGWDVGLSEAEMFECLNGHCVCDTHKNEVVDNVDIETSPEYEEAYQNWGGEMAKEKTKEGFNKYLIYNHSCDDEKEATKAMLDEYLDISDETRYATPVEYCPICTFKKFIDGDLVEYLAYTGIDMETIKKNIAARFDSYEEFKEVIKGDK